MKAKALQTLLFLFLVASTVAAQNISYPAEITVAQDGSGNYKSIQEAINSIRDLGEKEIKIYIKNGTYNEKIVIPSWKTNMALIGESAENTIISYDDYSGKINPAGKDIFGKEKITTYTSYTMLVEADDVTLENLTIANTAGKVGQAVALHTEGDRFTVKNCKILGYQDTLFAATENSRQYYQDCFIEGTTDFIFGKATVIFQNCTIKSLADSYITAAATSSRQPFGFVFFNCKLIADASVKKVFLGRPWRPYAKTVFIKCELGAHITSQGWNPWKGDAMFPDKEKTALYAEYKNMGAGANQKLRAEWAKQLTDQEFKSYTFLNILGGSDGWNPGKSFHSKR
ncbi:pectinesterase family protein [Pedobacter nototheniae]|uniref:pectinesterase family protein n=1 Tax=Pedobacter nototheniae TaxID=2488994 RepID=UPI002930FE9A|nr:pectinesterase family protein [Pedobacter nototheniae]